jgi:hypothetical protein
MQKPGRPFGVSIAIIVSAFMFSLLPLLQVGMVLIVRQHFLDLRMGDEGPEPIAMGGDFLGVPESSLIFQGLLALIFFVLAVLAWRGRPSNMRYILVGSVLLLTVIRLGVVVSQASAQQNFQAGVSSMDGIFRSLVRGELIISVLVALYVVWYMNRGPARAFYRGYYLPEPAEAARAET